MKEIKEGDKVRIKSLSWYNKYKDEDGCIKYKDDYFIEAMSCFCGLMVEVDYLFKGGHFFKIKKDPASWNFPIICVENNSSMDYQLEFNF